MILPVAAVITVGVDHIVSVLYDTGYEHTPLFMRIYMLIFVLHRFCWINTGSLLNGLGKPV